MAKQNRTHHWSLFVETNGWVRILRWDRAVILVSQRFKFCKKESLELAEFFYRISRVPREVVGHDTTIRQASEIEACRAAPHLNDFKDNSTIYDVPKSFSPLSSIENLEDYIAIEVPDDDGRRTVIAHKLRWTKEDAMSRATRGYVAFDLKAGRICYLKDSWPVAHLVTHEHELLRQLKEHKVPNVPTFVCGGIIANHRSLSPDDVSHEWNKGCVVFQPRDHQRFLVEEVGVSLSVPLEAARTSRSRDLVCRLIEIVTAHQAAFATAKILHRDISEGNALHMRWSKNGVVTVKALLIDWDMAKSTTAMATRFERTGTWFFLSINLLSDDPFLQSFSDDLESVLWLLVYHFLRFLPWQQGLRTITKASVKVLIDRIFQDERMMNSLGRYVGGLGKEDFVNRARELQFSGNKGATACLRTLLKQLQSLLDTRSEFISEQMELQEHSKLPTDPDEDQQDNGPHPKSRKPGIWCSGIMHCFWSASRT
ncbi:hypothetical protein BKA62DRAFT_817788 [Auriculariales sp. MPI-PUGE-AT-0066]|nr:hypothetical protein BKA62DRAFT_817788 [Auriculariales sp. MPI-PUGE-AT-0066]